jgi:hypothetical protein
VTKDGTNSADYTVTSSPAATVAAAGSTTFTVSFNPSASGARTAALHIASNDATKNPFNINLTGTGLVPLIVVEQPAGTGLTSGTSTVNFGSSNLGTAVPLSFTIKNTGTASLTGVAVTKDGTNNADYTVTSSPATTVAAAGSTTFTVSFNPAATGTRTAALHIASNDATKNPFNINVTGTGTTPLLTWATAAGLPAGQAGPDQTPQNDGVRNLLKFAFNMDPMKPDVRVLTVGANSPAGLPGQAVSGGKLRLEFLRRKAATNPGITYTPQFGASPDTLADFAGVPISVTSVDTTWERVLVEDPAVGASKHFGRVKIVQSP